MESRLNDFKLYINGKKKIEVGEFVYPGRTCTKDREIDAESLCCRKVEVSDLSREMNVKGKKLAICKKYAFVHFLYGNESWVCQET